MTIGERLRKLRKQKGLTLRDVGNELNISFSGLGEIERDERSCNSTTLEMLANFYNVSTDYLLGKNDEENMVDGFQAEILNSTKNLTAEQKQDVLLYINFLKSKGIINKWFKFAKLTKKSLLFCYKYIKKY